MENSQNGKFATADLYLSALLLCEGHKLIATDRHNPERVRFVIEPYPSQELLEKYNTDEATIRIGDFRRALRILRVAIAGGAR